MYTVDCFSTLLNIQHCSCLIVKPSKPMKAKDLKRQ